jgi:hypothetical protein
MAKAAINSLTHARAAFRLNIGLSRPCRPEDVAASVVFLAVGEVGAGVPGGHGAVGGQRDGPDVGSLSRCRGNSLSRLAEDALSNPAAWVTMAMWLRDGAVRPFGVRTSGQIRTRLETGGRDRIGVFPSIVARDQKQRQAEIEVAVVLAEHDLPVRAREHGEETDPVPSAGLQPGPASGHARRWTGRPHRHQRGPLP